MKNKRDKVDKLKYTDYKLLESNYIFWENSRAEVWEHVLAKVVTILFLNDTFCPKSSPTPSQEASLLFMLRKFICKPKAAGRVGLRKWNLLNEALAAKLVWQMYRNADQKLTKILSHKYLDNQYRERILTIKEIEKCVYPGRTKILANHWPATWGGVHEVRT